jgi:hypothetical protein
MLLRDFVLVGDRLLVRLGVQIGVRLLVRLGVRLGDRLRDFEDVEDVDLV